VAGIIILTDLPTALQSADLIEDMVAGANAKASRVAPCLVYPTSAAWAASTAYAFGDQVMIAADEFLEVGTAGTSGAIVPTSPGLGATVTDGTVVWARIAPTPDSRAEAKLILLGAVKRWAETGSGAFQAQTAGPFGQTVDTRQRTGFNLWPSEISALQDICSSGTVNSGAAFSITPGDSGSVHQPWCALFFGATYCSCGADLTNYEYPLYEGGVLSGDEY